MENSPHAKRMAMVKAEKAGGPRRDVVRLAEIAYGELSLPGTLHSRADEERLHRMWRGMVYLDESQAEIKDDLLGLEEAFKKNGDTAALLAGLARIREKVPPKVLGRPKKAT